MILDGKKIAGEILDKLGQKILELEAHPTLGVVLVGNSNTPSLRYIEQKRQTAEKIGIHFKLNHLPEDISQEELISEIQKYNTDSTISGYIIQLPLPKRIDSSEVTKYIDSKKDVDGFHPLNQGKMMLGDSSNFVPCTPAGIMKIFSYYDIELLGKKVVVLGRSNIVGKPMVNLLINAGATVTNCNSHTQNISEFTKDADIIISATGQSGIITADIVKKDAVIIDVGFSVIDGKLQGDCDFEKLLAQRNPITPVPGGVGPMTVAMLMQNTYLAHIRNSEL
ncbi:bifunctional 5,10-methylenetetrahydrofolate dehydrogenase/5,10-methenyltetrahydrofolate cyclohydrolase [Candidatus Gracilibacteria bacterium]|nr:bifunctional 5,10-methylenetetrahydrofolate dehydrogenase/5,10-methenyltetrahydrofolate cyclohydrolase [Candidatus Gracilibacteria bacterium]